MAMWDRQVYRKVCDLLHHAKQNISEPRALTSQEPLEPQLSQDCALCAPLRAPHWVEYLPTSAQSMLQAELEQTCRGLADR